ncbi:B-cell receptor CD22-like isoform X1 [Anomaloglossus baeobatrachus]|uniref:B-cell receptor CD22-like isoform X1 n=1 Tax=Anomaloglossus baeobatrachus TaxID=238106 RepID=UPI003F4FB058
MAGVKQMFLPLIFQGFYLSSLCQQWTFPSRISALIGSCVEIPCTYHPDGRSGQSSTVWYSYATVSYPEILNTKKKSSVMEEFKDRTSLVPGENSCTLRIDPVIEDDEGEYYPGIAEEKKTNAYDKNSGTLILNVRASPADIYLYMSPAIREGEATTIQCAAYHTCRSSPPSLQWNREGQIKKQSMKISEGSWREESELTYIPLYVDDGETIQCTATYRNGQKTVKSSTMSFSYPPQNVSISVIGGNETIEGSDVTLQCNSNAKPYIYRYEWYKGKDKTRLPYIGKKMGVRNVTRDVEPYSCAAINAVGRGESALMEIPVLYPAIGVHITVKNKTDFTELICDFLSSRPDVTHYTWRKDGSILQNQTGKTLTIDDNVENSGKYSCIAHNIAGESSSGEIYVKRDAVNLPLILGIVFGVFFLLLFILVIIFCIRKIFKSNYKGSQKYTPPAGMLRYNSSVKEENPYGNIHNIQNAQPDSMRSISSVEMNVNENYVIYSNSDVLQTTHDVEYTDLSHVQHDPMRSTSRVSHEYNVDYATVRH